MKDGHPGEQEDRRVEHIIPSNAVKKGIYEVVIEVTANGMFGLGPYRYQTPDVRPFSHSSSLLHFPLLLVPPLLSFLPTTMIARCSLSLTHSQTVFSP